MRVIKQYRVIGSLGTSEQHVWVFDFSSVNDSGNEEHSLSSPKVFIFPNSHSKKISRKIKKYLCVQGKGEFTMEYKEHSPVSNDVQAQLVKNYKGTTAAE